MPGTKPVELDMETLRSFGHTGATAPEVSKINKRSPDAVATSLHRAEKAGLAGWWPEPIGVCHNRRRWWAIEFKPAQCPPRPKPADSKPQARITPNGIGRYVDPRYPGTLPPGHKSVLDPQECRPWAVSASEEYAK